MNFKSNLFSRQELRKIDVHISSINGFHNSPAWWTGASQSLSSKLWQVHSQFSRLIDNQISPVRMSWVHYDQANVCVGGTAEGKRLRCQHALGDSSAVRQEAWALELCEHRSPRCHVWATNVTKDQAEVRSSASINNTGLWKWSEKRAFNSQHFHFSSGFLLGALRHWLGDCILNNRPNPSKDTRPAGESVQSSSKCSSQGWTWTSSRSVLLCCVLMSCKGSSTHTVVLCFSPSWGTLCNFILLPRCISGANLCFLLHYICLAALVSGYFSDYMVLTGQRRYKHMMIF